jgi:tetratricopeptide (TPR) repeat protein
MGFLNNFHLGPKSVPMLAKLAQKHYNEGNYQQAMDYYSKISSIDPREDFSHRIADCHMQLGNYREALKMFNQPKRFPEKWFYRDLPKIYLHLEEWEKAIIIHNRIHKRSDTSWQGSLYVNRYREALAVDRFEKNDFDEGIKICEDLLGKKSLDTRASYLYLKALYYREYPGLPLDKNHHIFHYYERIYADYREQSKIMKIKVFYGEEVFPKGKYKDEELSRVIEKDPTYILWCIINIPSFQVYNERITTKRFRNNKLLIEAITHNLIKSIFKKEFEINHMQHIFEGYLDYEEPEDNDWWPSENFIKLNKNTQPFE